MMAKFGEGGHRGGRTPGARNKFSKQLLEDAIAHWAKHGTSAMDDMRHEKPAEYVRVMFSILPRELTVESVVAELSDDEIEAQINYIRERLARPQDQPLLIEAKVNGNGSAVPADRE
jgi:hypothetical protein